MLPLLAASRSGSAALTQRLVGQRLFFHVSVSNRPTQCLKWSSIQQWRRTYTSNDKKTLPPSKAAIKSQTKTSLNTATEPKLIEKRDHANQCAPSSTPNIQTQQPKVAKSATATKTVEVETSKGLLSVTTTIEDSKINDIIFEKTKVVPPKTSTKTEDAKKTLDKPESIVEEASCTASDEVKSAAKATKTQKLQEAKSEMIGAAVAAADVAKTTVASAAAAVKELLSKKEISPPASSATEKPKTRIKVDFNRSSLERNFITPARAMSDFLLTPNHLENLPKIKRRSPYEQEPPMTVYWRKDVEAKAIEVWGSREQLIKELLRRDIERKQHQQNLFTVKRRLRDYRREVGSRAKLYDEEPGLRGKSGQVVLIAVGINGINFLFKVCGWLYTGSHSMFAEAVHSLADTINQLILAYGIHKSTQIADSSHPYGYSNMRYVSSLISGVGIFCVGTGLSVYHGITGLMHPEPISDLFWAFFILGGSLVSEGATLLVAINEVRRSAKLQGVSFKEYVISGKDPCINVVLTEDAAAVTSIGIAGVCMGLSQITGSPIFDALGSLFVGGILGAVASFIIYTNVQALVGKSIPEERLNKINAELESDIMIRAIHDVKGIDMGNSLVRYKAEMDFDGRELTRSYLDKQDLNELLKVVKSFQTVEEVEQFLLTHGENIVDLMGGEIDRIELKLRKKFPEIRHCDLEIL